VVAGFELPGLLVLGSGTVVEGLLASGPHSVFVEEHEEEGRDPERLLGGDDRLAVAVTLSAAGGL